jgi:hypothetical protein
MTLIVHSWPGKLVGQNHLNGQTSPKFKNKYPKKNAAFFFLTKRRIRVSKCKSDNSEIIFWPDTFKVVRSKRQIFGSKSRFSEKCQNPQKGLF